MRARSCQRALVPAEESKWDEGVIKTLVDDLKMHILRELIEARQGLTGESLPTSIDAVLRLIGARHTIRMHGECGVPSLECTSDAPSHIGARVQHVRRP